MSACKKNGTSYAGSVGRNAIVQALCPLLLLLTLGTYALLMHAQQLGTGTSQPSLVFTPGIMSTFVGTGVSGHTGDGGPAPSALVTNGLRGIAADAAADVFFVDDSNYTVRVVYEGGAAAAQLITAENPSITSPAVGYIYAVAGV